MTYQGIDWILILLLAGAASRSSAGVWARAYPTILSTLSVSKRPLPTRSANDVDGRLLRETSAVYHQEVGSASRRSSKSFSLSAHNKPQMDDVESEYVRSSRLIPSLPFTAPVSVRKQLQQEDEATSINMIELAFSLLWLSQEMPPTETSTSSSSVGSGSSVIFYPLNRENSGSLSDTRDVSLSTSRSPWYMVDLIRSQILDAVVELLCRETDTTIQFVASNKVAPFVSTTADNYDICIKKQYRISSGAEAAQGNYISNSNGTTSSIMSTTTIQVNDPVLIINSSATMTSRIPSSEWKIRYPVLWPGTIFLQQAATGGSQLDRENDVVGHADEDTDIELNIHQKALRLLQQNLQLELDLSIMEGYLDHLLARHLENPAMPTRNSSGPDGFIYSSPVGREDAFFFTRYQSWVQEGHGGFGATNTGSPSPPYRIETYKESRWSTMRITGLVLMCTTVLVAGALTSVATIRYQELLLKEAQLETEQGQQTHEPHVLSGLDQEEAPST
jgi:membrane-bound inhibitor of C-type lysozyme